MALFEFSKYGRLDLEGFIVTTLAIFAAVLVLFNSSTCYLVYILLSNDDVDILSYKFWYWIIRVLY